MDSATDDPLEKKGALKRVSPEEVVQAFELAIARDIRANPDDHDVLKKWRASMLTVTFSFEVLPNEDVRYWRGVNLRELLVSEHAAVATTSAGIETILVARPISC